MKILKILGAVLLGLLSFFTTALCFGDVHALRDQYAAKQTDENA